MISLGGIQLSRSLQWTNRDEALTIAQSVRYTRGGGVRVYQQKLLAGRPITLEADESTGWFTNAMRVSLLTMANEIGQEYTFVYFGETYQVIFDHANPPAVAFDKIIYRQVPDSTDYFMGRISLITV
jgi:hypothetical protein